MLPFYKIKKCCSSLHVMLLLVLVRCILSSNENYDCGVWIQIKAVFALDFRQYHRFIWTCQCCLRHVCKRVFTAVNGVQKFLCHFILSGVLRELNHEHTRFHPYIPCVWWTWNEKCGVLHIALLFKPREKTQKSTTRCNYGYGTIFLESC